MCVCVCVFCCVSHYLFYTANALTALLPVRFVCDGGSYMSALQSVISLYGLFSRGTGRQILTK